MKDIKRNYVAKNMAKFTKHKVEKDRTKYTRKRKHKGKEFPMVA